MANKLTFPNTYKTYRFFQNEEEGFFYIPLFQRKYQWDKKLISTLFDDLLKYKLKNEKNDNYNNYHLGSIYYSESYNKKYTGKDYRIVDGQQRITTFFLFFSVIKDLSEKYLEKNKIETLKTLDKILYINKEKKESDEIVKKLKIFREHEKDNQELIDAINNNKALDVKNSVFYETKIFIKNWVISKFGPISETSINDVVTFYDWIIYNTEITVITLLHPEKSDLHTFFENINLKKKGLNIFELIKNYIYGSGFFINSNNKIKIESLLEEIGDFFTEKLNLTDKNISKFLAYFLWLEGYLTKISENSELNLFEGYKNFFEKKNIDFFYRYLIFLKSYLLLLTNKRMINSNQELKIIICWIMEKYKPLLSIPLWYFYKKEEYALENDLVNIISIDKNLQKMIILIFKYIVYKTLNWEDVQHSYWWDEIKKLNNKEITLSEIEEKNLFFYHLSFSQNGREYSKKMKDCVKFLLFIINNKNENNGKYFSSFQKIQLEHLIPQNFYENFKWKLEIKGEDLDYLENKFILNSLNNITIIDNSNIKMGDKLFRSDNPEEETKIYFFTRKENKFLLNEFLLNSEEFNKFYTIEEWKKWGNYLEKEIKTYFVNLKN